MQETSHAFWRADGDFSELYKSYRTSGAPSAVGFSRRAIESIASKRQHCAATGKIDVDCDIDFLTCMVGRPADIKVTTQNLGSNTSPRTTGVVFRGTDGATAAVEVVSVQEDGRWKVDEVKCSQPK